MTYFSAVQVIRFVAFFAVFLTTQVAGAQWDPSEVGGLLLWVKADSNVVVDGSNKVLEWQDMSGQDNHLSEVAPNYQPLLVEDVLNGRSAVRFDGSNDNLEFTELTTIRSVFWVLKESDEATFNNRSLLGDNDSYHFLRGQNGEVWNAQFTHVGIQQGTTRIGFEEVDGVNTPFPSGFQVVSLRTTENVTASRFNRDRFYIDRAWNGDILELLIFDVELDSLQTLQVENYLADYYTQPLSLGPDIQIEDNFCDTTLSADPSFSVIQWSTGATSQEIAVNTSGTYWVEATDALGRFQSDTVEVQFPGTLSFPEQVIICEGNNYIFSTGLDEVDYSFMWSTGETSPEVTVDAGQIVSVSIEDAFGCIAAPSPTQVVVDFFASDASLQPGAELCAGNTLFLDPLGSNVEIYTWMDGSNEPTFNVIESGEVGLMATNENGCTYTEVLDVTVIGTAPEISWGPTDVWCAGSPLILEAEVLNGENVAEWNWVIDGSNYTGNPLELAALEAGEISFELVAVTNAGCASAYADTLSVYAVPEVFLNYDLLCAGTPVELWVDAVVSDGAIEEIFWTVGEEIAYGDTATFLIGDVGFQEVTIEVNSWAGCITTTQVFVDVQPSPSVSYTVLGQCLGQLSIFDAEIESNEAGNTSSYVWSFGDNTSSSLPSPSHLYASSGSFDVSLLIHAANGCAGSFTAPVEIVPLPQADFALSNACLGQPFQLIDQSTSEIDPIIDWQWEVEGIGEFNEQQPMVIFENEGFHQVLLSVETALGCTDSETGQIPVFEVPNPQFEVDPPIGSAPLEVQLINLTEGEASFFWDFGNGLTAEENAPATTFDVDGLYTIELTASNQYGCAANVSLLYLVDEPVMDLELVAVETTETLNGLLVRASMVNQGNFAVSDVAMRLTLPGDATLTEIRPESWEPAQVILYEWQVLLDPSVDDRYICASAEAYSGLAVEATPLNNTKCAPLGNMELQIEDVFPNPATDQIYIRMISPRTDGIQVDLTNARGQLVLDRLFYLSTGFNQLELDISSLSSGTYTLRVYNEYEEIVRQVVVL